MSYSLLLSAPPRPRPPPPPPPPPPSFSLLRRRPLIDLPLRRRRGSTGSCTLSSPSSPSFLVASRTRACFVAQTSGCREEEEDAPTSVELEPVASEERFDQIVAVAQQLRAPVIFLWMAKWCRKCIFLKPKLEKLAANYYPRVRFYCIDVNMVPQRLVSHAGVTKMPTIQLWKDSEKQAEVIGGHKAWLVVDDVQNMIDNDE